MSGTYPGTLDAYHNNITTITDDDEPSGSLFSTPIEQLQDNIKNTVRRYVLRSGDTFTMPTNVEQMRIQIIGPGGTGGTGGTTGGGGGGGAGGYLDTVFPKVALPAAGTVLTATNTPGSSFALSDGASFNVLALCGNNGANAATTTGGAGGDAGQPNSAFSFTLGTNPGAGGAAGGGAGVGPAPTMLGGGGGGGSAGASGGRGGDTTRLHGNTLAYGGGGPGASADGKQGNGGTGFGAGGGGGGGSSTGRGGGGGGGYFVPEYSATAATGGATSTAGGAGAAGVCILTVFRGGTS